MCSRESGANDETCPILLPFLLRHSNSPPVLTAWPSSSHYRKLARYGGVSEFLCDANSPLLMHSYNTLRLMALNSFCGCLFREISISLYNNILSVLTCDGLYRSTVPYYRIAGTNLTCPSGRHPIDPSCQLMTTIRGTAHFGVYHGASRYHIDQLTA